MKRLLLFAFILTSYVAISQNDDYVRIPMIGESAPKFTTQTTQGEINFPDDYFAKWKILFSHPADFTPVCSSEMLELANLQEDFKKLNTQIVVLSTDGLNSHNEWIKSLENIKYKDRDNVQIDFPLVSDVGLEISKKYGMLQPYSSKTKDIRGVFIIDPDNKVRAVFFYPMNVGRNYDEIKRTLTALQMSDDDNVLMPANWQEGFDVLIPSPKSVADSDKMKDKNNPKLYSYAWYMWFKKEK